MVFAPFLSLVDLKNLSEDELRALESRLQREVQITQDRMDELNDALTKVRQALGS